MMYESPQLQWTMESNPRPKVGDPLIWVEADHLSAKDPYHFSLDYITDVDLAKPLLYLCTWKQKRYFAVSIEHANPELQRYPHGLQDIYQERGEWWFALASRATQIVRWQREHRFCGGCGQALKPIHWEHAVHCRTCDIRHYPRISPCVIVIVTRDDQVLLARGKRHRKGLFSVLAGFVEAGESAEQAVHREVFEEVGVELGSIRYVGSQTWPYPGQLMLAFHAEWQAGEPCPAEGEILEVAWFERNNLPEIPGVHTIAGHMVRQWLQQA